MKWKDTQTPGLPLVLEGPRGQGSFQRGRERQRGEFGGMKVSEFDLSVCRRYYDHSVPWPEFRDRWFTAQAMKHARSIRFLRRLRRRAASGSPAR